MKITIKPQDGFTTRIETEQGPMILDEEETIQLMQNAPEAGYKVKVIFSYRRYHVTANVKNAALELAGLSGIEAAKANEVEF